ncbi:MAG: hypothetical protein ACRDGD_01955 [Candidatus Limnocylindria bacterium]
MRAFAGQLDRFTLAVVIGGMAIGLLWLVSVVAGLIVAGLVVVVACVVFVTRHRWLEIGLLMVVIGLVPAIAYRLFGAPPSQPIGTLPVELAASTAAEMLVIIGVVVLLVMGVLEVTTARHRERQAAIHDERKRRRLEDTPAS